ncbi:MAG: HAMP domain-containing histidine kinase [Parasporobacterium sp.]|nr:HAMP domain-containing histidine kinase [Parasporobacterium sp.]
MLKKLRKRVILTTMTAVTIVLVVIFFVINAINIYAVNSHSDDIIESLFAGYSDELPADVIENISASSGNLIVPEIDAPGFIKDGSSGGEAGQDPEQQQQQLEQNRRDEEKPPSLLSMMFHDVSMNELKSTIYFYVSIDNKGILKTDVSRMPEMSEDTARNIAFKVINGPSSGWYKDYRYKIKKSENGGIYCLFLSRGWYISNIQFMIVVSIASIVVCMGIILLIVYMLSGKFINPIAENMEKQKQFITDAGHELKTPMAIIQTNTDALELFNGKNKWTENIQDQISRLSNLMNNMLTLAKVDEAFVDGKGDDINLGQLMREYIRMFQETAAERNIHISDITDEKLIVKGDLNKVGQLFSILLDNAVKYSRNDSNIVISSRIKDKNVILEIENVTDYLPECEPERLFDRFFRPDSTRYSSVSGNGIGLSAARTIMELYGGTIACRYEQDDKIIFTLTFKK